MALRCRTAAGRLTRVLAPSRPRALAPSRPGGWPLGGTHPAARAREGKHVRSRWTGGVLAQLNYTSDTFCDLGWGLRERGTRVICIWVGGRCGRDHRE